MSNTPRKTETIENAIIFKLEYEQGYMKRSALVQYLCIMEDYHERYVNDVIDNMIRHHIIFEGREYIHLNEN